MSNGRSKSDSIRVLRMDSVDSSSPRCLAQEQQDAGELKDQNSTSKMPSCPTELPCSLKREVQVLEERLNDQFVMRRALEKALGYKPCSILSSNESCIPKVKLLFQCSESGMREKENKS
jgi:hypothetical protein